MSIITRLSGKIYPDSSFTIGVAPKPNKRAEDKEYDRLREAQYDSFYETVSTYRGRETVETRFISKPYEKNRSASSCPYQSGAIKVEVLDGCTPVLVPLKDVSVSCLDAIIERSPLFINGSQSSRKSTLSYGKNGITNYGRRVLENTALLLQRKYGKECLGFGTTTLPGMSVRTLKYLLANWGEVVRRFFQKLTRIAARVNCPFIYVGCTEIQPKRFGRTRLPVPHLHFVYVSKFHLSDGYLIHADEDYTAWNEAVNEVLGKGGFLPLMGEYGHVGSLHIKAVKKNAASYIGKYISKGAKEVKAMQDEGYTDFPRQWWFACMQCKDMFKASITYISGDDAWYIFTNLAELVLSKVLAYGRYVEVEVSQGLYKVLGCIGRMNLPLYNALVGYSSG